MRNPQQGKGDYPAGGMLCVGLGAQYLAASRVRDSRMSSKVQCSEEQSRALWVPGPWFRAYSFSCSVSQVSRKLQHGQASLKNCAFDSTATARLSGATGGNCG